MARHRTFDEIVEEIEHARPVHPLRTLIANHFYLDGWVSWRERGLALVMFNALLFVPFMMFLFFYPVPALIGLGGVLAAAGVLSSVVIWRRRARRK